MASSTKSAEKPAIQGTQRCNGRFLFLENDESRNPFVAAGAPNRVVCIGVNLSRAPSRHLPQVLLRSQNEHMGLWERIQGEQPALLDEALLWTLGETENAGWPTFRLRSAQAPCILQPVGPRACARRFPAPVARPIYLNCSFHPTPPLLTRRIMPTTPGFGISGEPPKISCQAPFSP